jgi:hypothetical protein
VQAIIGETELLNAQCFSGSWQQGQEVSTMLHHSHKLLQT